MDIAPLLYIGMTLERHLLLLIRGLLLAIATIPVVSTVSRVDFWIIQLLLRGPLATGLKESSPGLESLNAYVSNCEQINHYFLLLYGYLVHSLDIAGPVTEGIDDLDVLDVQGSIPGIVETFYVVSEAFIILLLDDLQGLYSRRTLIRALKIPDEHDT
jgi:hypothetical protein